MPHGKICYLEIPANRAEASAAFYSSIFGWKVRERGDGNLAFDDASAGRGSKRATARRMNRRAPTSWLTVLPRPSGKSRRLAVECSLRARTLVRTWERLRRLLIP
jgi:hypothetical protein